MRHNDLIDRSAVRKHELKRQQGDKSRNCVCQHRKRAPDGFSPDAVLIQEQRQSETGKIIKCSGDKRPHDIPSQNLKKGRCKLRQRQQFLKICKSHPVHEFRGYNVSAVVRKCNQDHEQNRQDLKDEYTDDRQREHRDIELFVEQLCRLLAEGQHASSLLDPLLHPVGVAHVSAVDTHKRRQDDPRKYSHQQHDNRVISLYAKPCIPSGRTQCKKTGEITTPAHCHIADHQDFRQEKAHAFSLCAIAELPCPHDDH